MRLSDDKMRQFFSKTKIIPNPLKIGLLFYNHFNKQDHLNHVFYARHYHSRHFADVSVRTGGGSPDEDRSGQGGSKLPKKSADILYGWPLIILALEQPDSKY